MRKFKILALGLALVAGVLAGAQNAAAAGAGRTITERDWTFSGPFGYFDQASLQRGFQVYREVCSGCHGLDYIAFRNFADLGYNDDEIKAIAAEFEVVDGPNEEGEMFNRAAIPADRYPNPYPNENAARVANGGAYPRSLLDDQGKAQRGELPLQPFDRL